MKRILVTTFFVLVFAVSVNAGQIGGGQIGLDANASLTLSTVTAIHEGMASATINRAVTAILHVSPNGDGTDGETWSTAYTTIQAALDAASTDKNECTLILIGINTGPTDFYDIDTEDPTWTGNYILQGSHRTWAKIKNDHDSATSIMKFTGYTLLIDLNFNLGVSGHGVIMTKGAFRLNHIQFVGEDLTEAATALHLDGATTLKHGKIADVDMLGESTGEFMTGLLFDKVARSNVENLVTHYCLKGIQIVDAASDGNIFKKIDIGDCIHANGIGIDIDAGNGQHFDDITFHGNTLNVDDEVGDSTWNNINAQLDVTLEPDNFTGVTVATGAGTAWTAAPVEVRAALPNGPPFKIVATLVEGSAAEKFRVRFSADSGATWFDDVSIEGQLNAHKREASAAPTSTDFIFNRNTQIVAESKSESGGNSVVVWLEIQEL